MERLFSNIDTSVSTYDFQFDNVFQLFYFQALIKFVCASKNTSIYYIYNAI